MVENAQIDYSSMETQLKMQEFADRLERCDNCKESWFVPNSFSFWYRSFHSWVGRGGCFLQADGFDEDYPNYIKPDVYYNCLFIFLDDDVGDGFNNSLRFNNETNP